MNGTSPATSNRGRVYDELEWADQDLIEGADALHREISAAQCRQLSLIVEVDRRELWRSYGAHDMAHWLWMRYGLSQWKALRWLACAH